MREKQSQVLTTTLRLPDSLQADALRLLEVTRQTVNTMLETLWPSLAEFEQGQGPAWKQVTRLLARPAGYPDRVWRCAAETAGRILRGQAARAAAFDSLRPLLDERLIIPAEGQRKARKNRRELNSQLTSLRQTLGSDADKLMLLLNVAEQACNFYLEHTRFPGDYFELQRVPVLLGGLLTFAGDDGPQRGQAYRLSLEEGTLSLALKAPNRDGQWAWLIPVCLELPESARTLLARGQALAPQLRVMTKATGEQIVVLDLPVEVALESPAALDACERVLAFDWGVRKLLSMVVVDRSSQQISRPLFFDSGGFDGNQARLRRQIDLLKAKRDLLPDDDPQRERVQREIDLCWAAYSRRNQALAHIASNVLLVVAGVYGCQLIVGEDLSSLKSTGRGRSAKGRWRNWRNNTTLRSAITNLLRYKTRLTGVRLRFEYPRQTSHTCPRCGKPAQTFHSPQHQVAADWGAWLRCQDCRWNGSRDYAAALNIARLGIAFLIHNRAFRMADLTLNPVSYSATGAALPFPPPGVRPRVLMVSSTTCAIRGWPATVALRPLFRAYSCAHSCT